MISTRYFRREDEPAETRMIERLLEEVARFSRKHPRRILLLAIAGAIASGYAFTVPLDFSFSSVMDREHPEVSRYFAASAKYGLGGMLPLLIEGPEEQLDRAVVAVQRALDDLQVVRKVISEPPREWLLARSPWLVEGDVFARWLALAQGPPSLEGSRSLRHSLEEMEARLAPLPPAGSRLITIVMARDTFELALDADDFPQVRRVVEETLVPLGVSGRFAGMPAIVTQEQEATIERMRVLGPLSLVLVLAILLWVERRPLVMASIGVPMLLSVGCTLGIIGFAAGKLSLMEAIFGVIVFGLGIDFAIHLLLRVREEQASGRGFDASMHRALVGTGRGIVAGGVTTAGAFLILAFAPDPVFYRLGLSGGLGLLLCLAFLLLMLPAEWAWIESRSPAPQSGRRSPQQSWLGRIAKICERAPLPVLAVGALLLVASAFEIPSLRYETNLERVFSRDIDAVDTARTIHRRFGVDPSPWLVAAEDVESARRLVAAFESDPVFARTESLVGLFRSDVALRREALDALAPGLTSRLRAGQLAASQLTGTAAQKANEALEPLALLLEARVLGPPQPDELPDALAERLIGPSGELLIFAFTAQPSLDSAAAARERRAAQAIAPSATSMNAIYEALIGTDRPWMPPIVVAVAIFITLVLRLDLGSLRLTGLALIPVVTSVTLTLGLLAAVDFSFNTVTLVAVPLLLGLAVDDGIHVVHRMVEQSGDPLHEAVASVSRSIALTTATTCGSVGLLLFTRHPGIESVAILLLVGLPIALLATVALVPAAAAVVRVQAVRPR